MASCQPHTSCLATSHQEYSYLCLLLVVQLYTLEAAAQAVLCSNCPSLQLIYLSVRASRVALILYRHGCRVSARCAIFQWESTQFRLSAKALLEKEQCRNVVLVDKDDQGGVDGLEGKRCLIRNKCWLRVEKESSNQEPEKRRKKKL